MAILITRLSLPGQQHNPSTPFVRTLTCHRYLGIPLYLIMLFGYKFWTKCKGVKPHEADFYTGKDIIDREEEEFLAAKVAKQGDSRNRRGWFYKTFVGWLF